MNTQILDKHFARIGARLQTAERLRNRRGPAGNRFSLDVRNDRWGEVFEIGRAAGADVAVEVLDVQPADRHLLVLVRENSQKHKFLCGHDERHWFVAAIPEAAAVGTVRQAKEALKPVEVRRVQASVGLKAAARGRRKNSAYVRQGEWFFVPAPKLKVDPKWVITNEPLVRGNGSKPHLAEFCFRTGGQSVYVCSRHPSGMTARDYQRTLKRNPDAKSWGWRTMVRNPNVFVRGRIRHADHKTIMLHEWHRVFMNTENQSVAMRHVAFLD